MRPDELDHFPGRLDLRLTPILVYHVFSYSSRKHLFLMSNAIDMHEIEPRLGRDRLRVGQCVSSVERKVDCHKHAAVRHVRTASYDEHRLASTSQHTRGG